MYDLRNLLLQRISCLFINTTIVYIHCPLFPDSTLVGSIPLDYIWGFSMNILDRLPTHASLAADML